MRSADRERGLCDPIEHARVSRRLAPRRNGPRRRGFGGGESGIRTHGTFRYTRFPSVRLKPLGHLSGSLVLLSGGGLRPRCRASSEGSARRPRSRRRGECNSAECAGHPARRPSGCDGRSRAARRARVRAGRSRAADARGPAAAHLGPSRSATRPARGRSPQSRRAGRRSASRPRRADGSTAWRSRRRPLGRCRPPGRGSRSRSRRRARRR